MGKSSKKTCKLDTTMVQQKKSNVKNTVSTVTGNDPVVGLTSQSNPKEKSKEKRRYVQIVDFN